MKDGLPHGKITYASDANKNKQYTQFMRYQQEDITTYDYGM